MQVDDHSMSSGESVPTSPPKDAMGRSISGATEEDVNLGYELSCLHADMIAMMVALEQFEELQGHADTFEFAVEALRDCMRNHGHQVVKEYLRHRATARSVLAEEVRKALEYVWSRDGHTRSEA